MRHCQSIGLAFGCTMYQRIGSIIQSTEFKLCFVLHHCYILYAALRRWSSPSSQWQYHRPFIAACTFTRVKRHKRHGNDARRWREKNAGNSLVSISKIENARKKKREQNVAVHGSASRIKEQTSKKKKKKNKMKLRLYDTQKINIISANTQRTCRMMRRERVQPLK